MRHVEKGAIKLILIIVDLFNLFIYDIVLISKKSAQALILHLTFAFFP